MTKPSPEQLASAQREFARRRAVAAEGAAREQYRREHPHETRDRVKLYLSILAGAGLALLSHFLFGWPAL